MSDINDVLAEKLLELKKRIPHGFLRQIARRADMPYSEAQHVINNTLSMRREDRLELIEKLVNATNEHYKEYEERVNALTEKINQI
jgi:hypothetical protein